MNLEMELALPGKINNKDYGDKAGVKKARNIRLQFTYNCTRS